MSTFGANKVMKFFFLWLAIKEGNNPMSFYEQLLLRYGQLLCQTNHNVADVISDYNDNDDNDANSASFVTFPLAIKANIWPIARGTIETQLKRRQLHFFWSLKRSDPNRYLQDGFLTGSFPKSV